MSKQGVKTLTKQSVWERHDFFILTHLERSFREGSVSMVVYQSHRYRYPYLNTLFYNHLKQNSSKLNDNSAPFSVIFRMHSLRDDFIILKTVKPLSVRSPLIFSIGSIQSRTGIDKNLQKTKDPGNRVLN